MFLRSQATIPYPKSTLLHVYVYWLIYIVFFFPYRRFSSSPVKLHNTMAESTHKKHKAVKFTTPTVNFSVQPSWSNH